MTRGDHTFDVADDDCLHEPDWSFWNRFEDGWEQETLDAVDELCDGGTFLDVGAWVGPVALWASRCYERVVAVEPDPTAWRMLARNLNVNCTNADAVRVAVDVADGVTHLHSQGRWGDSMSTLLARGEPLEVAALTFETLFDWYDLGAPVVKVDIEGGEGQVLPAAAGFLADRGCTLIVSLHPQWWTHDPQPEMRERFDLETIADRVVVARPL